MPSPPHHERNEVEAPSVLRHERIALHRSPFSHEMRRSRLDCPQDKQWAIPHHTGQNHEQPVNRVIGE
jgi:hypothetical protein